MKPMRKSERDHCVALSHSSGGDAKYEKEREEHQQLWQAVKGMGLMWWAER